MVMYLTGLQQGQCEFVIATFTLVLLQFALECHLSVVECFPVILEIRDFFAVLVFYKCLLNNNNTSVLFSIDTVQCSAKKFSFWDQSYLE